MPTGIVDVEFGGAHSGPFRCVISYGSRQIVLYRGPMTLAELALDAAHTLLLARQDGERFVLTLADGLELVAERRLKGDLVAELGIGRAR